MKIKCFTQKLFGVNTYIVWDAVTLDCAIVDPGMVDSEDMARIENFISSNGLNVTKLINTHAHLDHVAGNQRVQQRYGVKPHGNSKDNMLAGRVRQQAQMFGLPMEMFSDFTIAHCLKQDDILSVGKGSLKVLEVPGHSPGSIALYDAADGWVITGDALFEQSIGRTDLPGGDFDTLLRSIRTQLFVLPDNTVVYPGHGTPTEIGIEKKTNPFLNADSTN